jgi:hypothetical protein
MHRRGWDYVTFERNAGPGSFFEKYPVHRQLISLNKRYSGRSSKEFNLRHDWNSLLETDVLPMPNRTSDRFPNADVLVEYLRDFAAEQEAAGRIQYRTTVLSIAKKPPSNADNKTPRGFVLSLEVAEQTCPNADADGGCLQNDHPTMSTIAVGCKKVIHAGGNWKSNRPKYLLDQGFDLAEEYSDLPPEGYEKYADKKVAIFGMGNAAMEAAEKFAPHTAFVHAFPGRGKMTFPHFAYESRYVGGVRTWRSQIIDAYTLKSLDGGFPSFAADGILVRKCGDDGKQLCLFTYKPPEHPNNEEGEHIVELAYQPMEKASMDIVLDLHEQGCILSKHLVDAQYSVLRSPVGTRRDEEIRYISSGSGAPGNKGRMPEQLLWPAPGIDHPYVHVNASCMTQEIATRYGKLAGLGGMCARLCLQYCLVLCSTHGMLG